jgi:hypothetical protein
MVPTADWLHGDMFRVYISGRDDENRSQIGFFDLDISNPIKSAVIQETPVLKHGELGCFDDNGVTPSCIVTIEDKKYLYYIGWKPRSTTRMSLHIGLAISLDGGNSFSRYSRATIVPDTDMEPYSILTAPYVLKDGELWRLWYVSGEGWKSPDLPLYNIKTAISSDGIHWDRRGEVSIDFVSDDEVSLARPCVVKNGNVYRMWYSVKKNGGNYRMGYAESVDGISFERMDHVLTGLAPSPSGWDSEMIEYPCVINHKGAYYMFYNGNDYGRDGVGLAVLEED